MGHNNNNGHTSTNHALDLRSLYKKGEDISEVFFELTKHLKKTFSIDRGVLCLRTNGSRQLAAISTWSQGNARDGLAINLPADSSLFEKVIEDGRTYIEDFCATFSGNFFERKLLLDDESRSFVIKPIKADGETIGLYGYSSQTPTAFTVFDDTINPDITTQFTGLVQKYLAEIE